MLTVVLGMKVRGFMLPLEHPDDYSEEHGNDRHEPSIPSCPS
jgi:hypothetical protein